MSIIAVRFLHANELSNMFVQYGFSAQASVIAIHAMLQHISTVRACKQLLTPQKKCIQHTWIQKGASLVAHVQGFYHQQLPGCCQRHTLPHNLIDSKFSQYICETGSVSHLSEGVELLPTHTHTKLEIGLHDILLCPS